MALVIRLVPLGRFKAVRCYAAIYAAFAVIMVIGGVHKATGGRAYWMKMAAGWCWRKMHDARDVLEGRPKRRYAEPLGDVCRRPYRNTPP